MPLTDMTPVFRNIYIKDVICSSARRAMYFNGLPEQNIENINIENVTIHSQLGAELAESKNITFKNVNIYPLSGAALRLSNVSDVKVEGLTTDTNIEKIVEVTGRKTQNVEIKSSYNTDKMDISDEVKKSTVKLIK